MLGNNLFLQSVVFLWANTRILKYFPLVYS